MNLIEHIFLLKRLTMRDKIIEAFQIQFGTKPIWITRSPGRVNIIGEHTDYNDGFVLPIAINYAAWVALRPREDNQVKVWALDMDDSLTFNLDEFTHNNGGWQEYIKGVAWALQERGFQLKGWEGVFTGDVPIGAGLSSSASLELALARAFALVSDLPWDPRQMALVCQLAENQWVGVNSGIMDQMISASGKKNKALLIDCRDLNTKQIPLPTEAQLVILDTATRRGLVDSAYNERRAQCEAVACHFNANALRDVTSDQLLDKAGILNIQLYQRANHVISENERVLEAVQALQDGDLAVLGKLMNASHTSLRDDFEVSREEMDQMVAIAQSQPGCYGARLTGAGFGGCVIALVEKGAVEEFKTVVAQEYLNTTGLESKIYITTAVEGTNYQEL
jgi:galactokinase